MDSYIGGPFQKHGTGRNPDGGLAPDAECDTVSLHASVSAKLGTGTLRLMSLFIREDPSALYTSDGA